MPTNCQIKKKKIIIDLLRLPSELRSGSQDPAPDFSQEAPNQQEAKQKEHEENLVEETSTTVPEAPPDAGDVSRSIPPEPTSKNTAKTQKDTVRTNPLSQVRALPRPESESMANASSTQAGKDNPPPTPSQDQTKQRWYLGVDVGNTGISAVLLNQQQQCLYPISWSYAKSSQPQTPPHSASAPSTAPWFRLPTTLLLYFAGTDHPSTLAPKWGLFEQGVVTPETQPLKSSEHVQTLQLRASKPYLNITIPHYASQSGRWEPEILHGGRSVMLNQSYSLPLSGFYQALQMLLATLSPAQLSTFTPSQSSPSIVIESRVWGLPKEKAQRVLKSLAGVVVGYPSGWSAAYRFNVREAVLGARLVNRADQVAMVGDAIATLLSRLPSADGSPITLPDVFKQASLNADPNYHGPTLVLNGGAGTTELAIAHVSPATSQSSSPSSLHVPILKPNNFIERSLAYGGDALDQDIISQLLYPRLTQLGAAIADVLGQIDLLLPSAGEPDGEHRLLLQHQLHQAPMGPDLVQQARRLKLELQTQETSVFAIANQQWTINQDDLGNRVLLPYVQRLQREVNALLERAGMQAKDIRHIICSGGTVSLRFITLWLQKTFPLATITQDIHQGDSAPTLDYNIVPTCSRVAYGLASLPMHPHLMDWVTHQPCDYDLLMEMGRTLPAQPLTLRTILGLLKRRGISPTVSQPCVVALLDGQIPAGLVPQGIYRHTLTDQSKRYVPYHRLLAAPLFKAMDTPRSEETIYHPNRQQWIILQQYLTALTAGTRQTLFQPLVGMGTGHPHP